MKKPTQVLLLARQLACDCAPTPHRGAAESRLQSALFRCSLPSLFLFPNPTIAVHATHPTAKPSPPSARPHTLGFRPILDRPPLHPDISSQILAPLPHLVPLPPPQNLPRHYLPLRGRGLALLHLPRLHGHCH